MYSSSSLLIAHFISSHTLYFMCFIFPATAGYITSFISYYYGHTHTHTSKVEEGMISRLFYSSTMKSKVPTGQVYFYQHMTLQTLGNILNCQPGASSGKKVTPGCNFFQHNRALLWKNRELNSAQRPLILSPGYNFKLDF